MNYSFVEQGPTRRVLRCEAGPQKRGYPGEVGLLLGLAGGHRLDLVRVAEPALASAVVLERIAVVARLAVVALGVGLGGEPRRALQLGRHQRLPLWRRLRPLVASCWKLPAPYLRSTLLRPMNAARPAGS